MHAKDVPELFLWVALRLAHTASPIPVSVSNTADLHDSRPQEVARQSAQDNIEIAARPTAILNKSLTVCSRDVRR